MTIFEGSGVAIVTPFTNDSVDYDKLKELLEWHVQEGTDAIVICGTTGEATTMTLEEKKSVIKFTVDVINGRIPVIAGSGSNNTKASVEMSKYCESVGVSALLVITPYYNKTNHKGLLKHFETINDAVNIPIILYNVPSRTNMNITPSTLKELSKLKNIVAIKEASGNLSQIAEMKALCGDSIDIYSGNDDQIIPIMSLGGKGVISVLANVIPKEVHNMTRMYLDGKCMEASKIQIDTLELTNALFSETNPIPVKTALNLMGCNVGPLRLPLYEMDDKLKLDLENTLKKYKLI
ncbi:4-hydroxy-tetrahydrodipicolinate synthase [Clostridium baratii]|uniref:4-hydroxy-tetrahydrodipicolinate synthase n=1 Tax=Clostridium baratii TaxID=1561 RepID=UPI0006BAF488|nr:4-hydroxy-tetrahydrodipicolinate synthase [Clostridium baratii]MBS6006632.1 4-hydroxy-tetrahydrodipicolinate synthase [Clostridium baratii]MBT9832654.1 4-hydroxy-tetrahydrodipicolinate synthase [Clostridium baratii]MDU1053695.1 4-hydroxy-tetrahydrodipicolinate synthase [Clostridium baratii]MDY3208225.1 4-hydroxy-tetrahydrodipicolinate synthase [Clostridium baratii]STA99419.1 dihydrodipicolinate synthase [Clostridium baratii]